jgi:hypothetical protein
VEQGRSRGGVVVPGGPDEDSGEEEEGR